MLTFLSCRFAGSNKDRDCQNLVAIDKMVDLLGDIYLMEGYFLANFDLQVKDTIEYYFAGIFNKHNVDYQKFRMAMDCYLYSQVDIDSIHERVLRRISLRQEKAARLGVSSADYLARFNATRFADCFLVDVCY